jgi:hypothetical protein
MIAEQKIFDKLKLQESLVKNFQEVVHHLKDELEVNKSMSDLEEGDTLDPEDYSKQNESNDMIQILKNQLSKTLVEIDKLARIDFTHKEKVGTGAVVKTEKFMFFIGVAISPFAYEGNQIVGISTDAPIYNSIRDKKVGDSYEFSGMKDTIIAIY